MFNLSRTIVRNRGWLRLGMLPVIFALAVACGSGDSESATPVPTVDVQATVNAAVAATVGPTATPDLSATIAAAVEATVGPTATPDIRGTVAAAVQATVGGSSSTAVSGPAPTSTATMEPVDGGIDEGSLPFAFADVNARFSGIQLDDVDSGTIIDQIGLSVIASSLLEYSSSSGPETFSIQLVTYPGLNEAVFHFNQLINDLDSTGKYTTTQAVEPQISSDSQWFQGPNTTAVIAVGEDLRGTVLIVDGVPSSNNVRDALIDLTRSVESRICLYTSEPCRAR